MYTVSVDILLEILEYTDAADLLVLSRANKVFASCAQDALYRHLLHPNMLAACISICQNPDLGRRVRSLEINRHLNARLLGNAPNVISRALLRMPNLHTLKLLVNGPYASLLRPCVGSFSLHTFHSDFFCNADMLHFLKHQPELREMKLGHSYPYTETFDATCLPNLTKLSASMSWAQMILGVCPVNDLTISITASGSKLSPSSTKGIRRLQISGAYLRKMPVREIALSYPSLTHLSIDDQGPGDGASILEFTQWFTEILSTLRTLRQFTILGYRTPDGVYESEKLLFLINKVSEPAPKLEGFNVLVTMREYGMMAWTRMGGVWEEVDKNGSQP